MDDAKTVTFFEAIGGGETIRKLVEAFYPKVYADPELAPLFEGDMVEIMAKQELFLTQFTGGPALYSEQHGPPMMRRRHLPFEITPRRAEAWLRCMEQALDEIELEGHPRRLLFEKLAQVAMHMVNSQERE